MLTKKKSLVGLAPGVDFINTVASLFLEFIMRGLFGAQCLANGQQIWQKVCKFKLEIWRFEHW